jgi:recombinational DNA repair protein RecR
LIKFVTKVFENKTKKQKKNQYCKTCGKISEKKPCVIDCNWWKWGIFEIL